MHALGSRLLLSSSAATMKQLASSLAGAHRQITWSHRADDPYSWLLAQVLAEQARSGPAPQRPPVVGLTVAPAPASAMPHPDLWQAYALEDARALAERYGLVAPKVQPKPDDIARAHAMLLNAEGGPNYVRIAADLGAALWSGESVADDSLSTAAVERRLANNRWQLERSGHYSTGMLGFRGVWYWGLDRLEELSKALQSAGHAPIQAPRPRPVQVLGIADDAPIEMFFSVRSPYSYLAMEQIDAVAERVGRRLVERPVLPMVARGMSVQLNKKLYILLDASREAARHGIAFGPLVDPLGEAVERTLAVHVHLDHRLHDSRRAHAFVRQAMRGIWSEGLDMAIDGHLRRVAGRAGVSWADVRDAVSDTSWRAIVEENRRALERGGLWGVPSFRVGPMITWGRDRLWRVEATAT